MDLLAYQTGSPIVRANAVQDPIHPELQDREFVAAVREGREPNSSIAQVMSCYPTLAALEEQLDAGGA